MIEIGTLWLHLPTGAAAIHGIVPGRDGGPETASPVWGGRPIGEGGRLTLFEGLDPLARADIQPGPVVVIGGASGFDDYGFNWAGRSTCDVQAKAERHGFRTVTRREAAELLDELGITVRSRRNGRGVPAWHDVLWLDQLDGLTWHVRESLEGRRWVHERRVFVARDLQNVAWPGLTCELMGRRDTVPGFPPRRERYR